MCDCLILCFIQIENLKIVTQKDREIETFQQRVTEAEALKVSHLLFFVSFHLW